ncbi:MAG: cytochrome b/b6 domain-containing protein, partial [Sideroxyarcus sp.]|nr:cytochrome b/b6 domain-containing protein [Sideroxyarcus sp.]
MITGFEVHGSYKLLGFGNAVNLHTVAAWTLLTLWAFTIFWQFTTDEWKQYIPTLKKVDAMVRYYAYGIFLNAPNPFHKTAAKKHNPLQRLAYLALLSMVSPIIWVSGLFYLFYASWKSLGADAYLTLEAVAFIHTAGAFMMLVFFIAHVYLTTTGHTPTAHIKTMVTGWEEVD